MTARSTQQRKDDALETAKIEHFWSTGHQKVDVSHASTKQGKQKFFQKGRGQAHRLCRMLAKRIHRQLDRDGNISQLQSLLQVGCSISLATRAFQYNKVTGMKGVPDLWGLLFSCLGMLEIKFEMISVPVLRIWEADSLGLAEILITDLASSYVEWGGLDPTSAGNRDLKIKGGADMSKELKHVFVNNTYLQDNLDADLKIQVRRGEMLKHAFEPQETLDQEMRDLKTETKEVKKLYIDAEKEVGEVVGLTEDKIKAQYEEDERMEEAAAQFALYRNFNDDLMKSPPRRAR